MLNAGPLVNPRDYPQLVVGAEYLFKYYRAAYPTRGRLLYAQNRKNYTLDEHGNVTAEFVLVSHRTGYEPSEAQFVWHDGEDLRVHSVHLEAGLFSIWKLR